MLAPAALGQSTPPKEIASTASSLNTGSVHVNHVHVGTGVSEMTGRHFEVQHARETLWAFLRYTVVSYNDHCAMVIPLVTSWVINIDIFEN